MFKRKTLAVVVAVSISQLSYAELEEVVVTATKRSASTQDIPVAVTALGEETLDQLGIKDFSDYLVHLPGVTAGGAGPGQNTIYIRGVASTTPNLTSSGVAGLAPNVALYLDEQPLSQPGRNLDVYAADMARVEVLAGPQGTLFGASSQAGTVRLITNKPDFDGLSGKLKLGTAYTKGGDPSNNFEGVINVPLNDNIAVRAVAYIDKQGGFIDNVAGVRTTQESARFRTSDTIRSNGLPVGAGRAGFQSTSNLSNVNFLEANNANLVEDDFNKATYKGGRVSALWQINDDWDLLVGAAQQTIDTDGVFFVDPDLDDLEIQRFEDDQQEDSFENFNWTLTGRLAELEVVYTGAFTERETEQNIDYTDYLFVGQYIPYYICDASVSYPGANDPSGTCQAPNLYVDSETETKTQTHEIRFSTDQSQALRVTAGAYYSDMELRENNSFVYRGSTNILAFDNTTVGFGPNFSAGFGPTAVGKPTSSAKDSTQFAPGVIFRNDVLRTDTQKAVFGELSYDFTEEFSVTVGARWYDVEVDLRGSAAGSFGNLGATVDNNAGNNLDVLFSDANPGAPDVAATDGVIGKVTLMWTPNDDMLLYTTWSEGFRPGFLNRPGGATNADKSFTVPFAIDTDNVTNYEFGWKTDLLNGSLRFNGSLFYIEIDNMQTGIFDPSITNLFFVSNAADATVTGLEGDFIWGPESVQGLTVSGGFSVLDTEIADVLIPTKDVTEGDSLAFAPKLQLNLQARYEWDLASDITAHVMPHAAYSDEVYTDIISINRYKLNSWVMFGITAGVSTDKWSLEAFVDNLNDKQAQLSGNYNFDRARVTVARPRTAGIRFSYNFN